MSIEDFEDRWLKSAKKMYNEHLGRSQYHCS
jgi:hypothetical protein